MDVDDIASQSDDDYTSRRAVLEPAIRSVVDALGGYEDGRYRFGDECYGCLKDLKKFWRKDDTDDERTVARVFWACRVLPNDLVPILLETAGKGMFEDKRAIAVADLMTAMTWPIDLAEELKELDEELDKGTDYTQLLQSHLHYKAALLKPGVFEALLGIVLPCLAKGAKERTERDVQVIGVVLYLIRNLAFIKDLPSNLSMSADQAEYSTLQSKLVKRLSETNILDLLLTIASNATEDSMFNGWNALLLEIFYLLFRGVKPSSLVEDQAKESTQNLRRLLAAEDTLKRNFARNTSSRHSRFGTTISVSLNPKHSSNSSATPDSELPPPPQASSSSQAFVLHRQQALHQDAGTMLDKTAGKKARAQKAKKVDELGRDENLSLESRTTLQGLAKTFLESCFNPFLSSLLKDIKAERPKIVEKDNLRLLFITKWFLEFFLSVRTSDKSGTWKFGLVAEVTERDWIVWVLRRMREAVDDKPKLWTELQAGVECLTQLVLLIDAMNSSGEPEAENTSETLQSQIVYNGELLDISFDSLKMYKEGTQSLAYLDSSIHLAYALLRLLERYAKKEGDLVRQKKKRARRKKNNNSAIPDVEEELDQEEEDEITETTFTFDAYEQKFANADVTQTLIVYLSRFKEFSSDENMKRIVNLMHRQAIKAKAEGLFFKVSTLNLFKSILDASHTLPRTQPYKDLVALINYLLRQFFKAVAEDSFLIVEAFYPKNRGKWKALSSWEPPAKALRPDDDTVVENRWPADVKVKKGYSWDEQLGIAIKCLVEEGKEKWVEWVKEILMVVIGQRQRIIEDTDGSSSQAVDLTNDGDDEDDLPVVRRGPSKEAIAKFANYMIPYVSDEQADAATKEPHLKLVFRLLSFELLEEDVDELEWFVPSFMLPEQLQRNLNVISQFLIEPIDLGDKKASSLLSRKARKRRRRRQASPTPSGSDNEDEPRRKRKEKKKKETKQYKSAQFIEDSDVEEGEWEAFFAREKELRERMKLAAIEKGRESGAMLARGTKKRRRKGKDTEGQKKRRKGSVSDVEESEKEVEEVKAVESASEKDSDDEGIFNPFASPKAGPSTARTSPSEGPGDMEAPKAKPRPRPRPKMKAKPVEVEEGDATEIEEPRADTTPPSPPPKSSPPLDISDDDDDMVAVPRKPTKKKALVLSDDED